MEHVVPFWKREQCGALSYNHFSIISLECASEQMQSSRKPLEYVSIWAKRKALHDSRATYSILYWSLYKWKSRSRAGKS